MFSAFASGEHCSLQLHLPYCTARLNKSGGYSARIKSSLPLREKILSTEQIVTDTLLLDVLYLYVGSHVWPQKYAENMPETRIVDVSTFL